MNNSSPDRAAIAALGTEKRNQQTMNIDLLSTPDMVRVLNDQNRVLADAVAEQNEQIAAAVDIIVGCISRGGRLIYVGAGTSGRLGILDASECPPTYGVSPDMVMGFIAGGDVAIKNSVENAEDDPEAAQQQLKLVNLCDKDAVCGVAASGRTPYVVGALKYAHSVGAATICVTNNKNSVLSQYSDAAIEVAVGAEPISGSTRMKSGTAQKLVLNILSTATMVKLGKTYGNLMVDLKVTNEKLRRRCANILAQICPESTEQELVDALEKGGWSVKTAAVMLRMNADAETAQRLLEQNNGRLRAVFGEEVK